MSYKEITELKTQNIKNVINCIRESAVITKSEVMSKLGLSFATVSSICNDLLAKGIISECNLKNVKKAPGRVPKYIKLNTASYYGICIDLQNYRLVNVAVVSICNEEIFRINLQYNNASELESVIRQSYKLFKIQAAICGIEIQKIIGVGVSVPAVFDIVNETVENCAIIEWNGKPFKKIVQDIFNFPAYIDNEANLCAGLLITRPTANYSTANTIYVHMGEGLGVGIIAESHMLRGNNGFGAEVSHLPIGDPGLKCRQCGSYGCVETDLSVNGFLANYRLKCGDLNRDITWKEFIRLVKGEDEAARHVMRENGRILGKLLVILLSLFDPSDIYIGGMVSEAYEELIVFARDEVNSRLGYKLSNIPIYHDKDSGSTVIKGVMEMLIKRWEVKF